MKKTILAVVLTFILLSLVDKSYYDTAEQAIKSLSQHRAVQHLMMSVTGLLVGGLIYNLVRSFLGR